MSDAAAKGVAGMSEAEMVNSLAAMFDVEGLPDEQEQERYRQRKRSLPPRSVMTMPHRKPKLTKIRKSRRMTSRTMRGRTLR